MGQNSITYYMYSPLEKKNTLIIAQLSAKSQPYFHMALVGWLVSWCITLCSSALEQAINKFIPF